MTRRFELGERGRVPFALVGVVLLVTSALFAAAAGGPRPAPEPAVDVAVERTTADARTAVRTAVAEASVAAASDPVVEPADTRWGDILDGDEPFRSALEARVYTVVRERLAAIERAHRGVRATASLPATPIPAALERATDRVSVERTGPNGQLLRATVSNVSVRATRDGRVVGNVTETFSVVVPTPVLAVHDRVETYRERLNTGLTQRGLNRRLTARLWAVAWARGYAQYGGAPVSNVVANRHVAVMTNGALLGVQRATFGQSDPDGREALGSAMLSAGLKDVLAAHGPSNPELSALLDEGLREVGTPRADAGVPRLATAGERGPDPTETMNVSVGRSADAALSAVRSELDAPIAAAYAASVRTVAADRHVSGGPPERPAPPANRSAGNWTLRDEVTVSRIDGVTDATSGPTVATPEGYHRLWAAQRTVRVRHEKTALWAANGTVATTRAAAVERRRATVAVVGRHEGATRAPDRPIDPVHERGGPLGGPNLRDIAARANATVVDSGGGIDGLAADAVRGSVESTPETVHGDRPAGIREWVYGDLVELRERLRDVTVAVERGRVGTFEARPAAELAERLRANRSAYVDAPATYDGVAETARVAARARLFEQVVDELEARADRRSSRVSTLRETLADGVASLSLLRDAYDASRAADRGSTTDDLKLHVDGAPPYLTTAAVTHEAVPAVDPNATTHPLVAENTNYATLPYADAVGAVTDAALSGPSRRIRLGVAARSLRAVDAAVAATGNESLGSGGDTEGESATANRTELRREVRATTQAVAEDLQAPLLDVGVGDSPQDREQVVDGALAEWDSVSARALAVANGSVVESVVGVARRRAGDDLEGAYAVDRLRLGLRSALRESLARREQKVDGPLVESVTKRIEGAVGDRLEDAVSETVEKRYGRVMSRLPAGIPVAPPVAPWYATVNVWSVTVRGEYERFAVETPRRTPAAGDASLSYVRDGGNVTLDVDDDGVGERLGVATHVRFSAETAVAVAVPGGGTGVGDTDGVRTEQSAGWPRPGPGDRPSSASSGGGPESGNRTAGP